MMPLKFICEIKSNKIGIGFDVEWLMMHSAIMVCIRYMN